MKNLLKTLIGGIEKKKFSEEHFITVGQDIFITGLPLKQLEAAVRMRGGAITGYAVLHRAPERVGYKPVTHSIH